MISLRGPEREFLEAVRDGKDVFPIIKKHDIGYGWAIENGLVTKHRVHFEFYLTDEGRKAIEPKGQ